VLAYFGFRYNLPLTIRSGLYPIFKEKIHGPLGHAVDVFALVGTIFGIATTLGYGVMQLSAGITRLTGMDTSGELFRFGLIGAVIALAGVSAVTGLDKGVKRLSELNLFLAIVLLLFVLLAGPTQYLLGALSENIGNYVSSLSQLTFRTFTYSETRQAGWFGNWTLLYWAWWSRPLHRPHLPRAHPARIHPGRPVRAHRLQPAVDDGVRQRRHLGQPA